MGGASFDSGQSIAVDASGNVYVTGDFTGTAYFDPSDNTVSLTGDGTDIFIAKYDADGNYLWANRMGGSIGEIGRSIAVDAVGDVYVAGHFTGTANFNPSGAPANLTSSGNEDIFMAKYDASGNYLWAKRMGGSGYDRGHSIALDASGNIYMTGDFQGAAYFNPSNNNTSLISAGESDVFMAKYDASGNYLWAKSVGGLGTDHGSSIALDVSGNVHVIGWFYGTSYFDPSDNAVSLNSAGSLDVFIAKYDAAGNYLWAKKIGGSSSAGDAGRSIAVDASGNVYAIGDFTGTAYFDHPNNTVSLTSAGNGDIFIAKYDASGNYLWAKKMGGSGADYGNSIALDASGNVYATGNFRGTADFDPSPNTATLTSSGSGHYDIFTAQYDASGNYLWAQRMGGSNDDHGYSIALDASGNVYVTGEFRETAYFDPANNTLGLTSVGSRDVFIAKYHDPANPISVPSLTEALNGPVIHPNPAHSTLNIQAAGPVEAVSVYNALGTWVRTETRASFSVENLPAGVYLLHIRTAKGTRVARVVKE